jgi:hypothetical protein
MKLKRIVPITVLVLLGSVSSSRAVIGTSVPLIVPPSQVVFGSGKGVSTSTSAVTIDTTTFKLTVKDIQIKGVCTGPGCTTINSSGNPALVGTVTFLGGTNVILSQSGSTITVNSTASGGGGSGSTIASPQYQVPFYSGAGSTTTLTGSASLVWNSSSTALSISSGTISVSTKTVSTNVSAGSYILVRQHYAYLAASSGNSFTIFDVSNPTNPVLMSQITNNAGGAEQFDVVGKYMYLSNSASNAMSIWDISNPSKPSLISIYQPGGSLLQSPVSLKVMGNYAYLVNLNGGASSAGLTVIDISSPTAPVVVGSTQTTNLSVNTYLQIKYPYAYVSSGCNLNVIDISVPTNPLVVGSVVPTGCINNMIGMDFYGRYMYVDGGNGGNLYVMDISTPTTPVYVQTVSGFGNMWTPKVVGKKLFSTTLNGHGIVQYDLTNPANPVLINYFVDNTNLPGVDDLTINGNYLYATSDTGFTILNVGAVTVPTMAVGSLTADDIESTHDIRSHRVVADGTVITPTAWVQDLLRAKTAVVDVENVVTTNNTGATNVSSTVYISTGGVSVFNEYKVPAYTAIATVTWNQGNDQVVTLTANTTMNFIAPTAVGQSGTSLAAHLNLLIKTGAGSFTVSWPGTVKWGGGVTPTITTAASGADLCTFYYEQTTGDYFGQCAQNYAP